MIYMLTIVFEGPVRFLLFTVGAGSLLYARDLLAVLPVVAALAGWFSGAAVSVPVAGVLGLLLVHCVIGLISLPEIFQAMFGLKMWLPFLMGLSIAPLLRGRERALVLFAGFALVSTALGVIANSSIEYPWIGLSYDTAFGETSGAKQWWTGAGLRLPGFARSSVGAASLALISLGPVLASRLSWAAKLVSIGLAGVTIYLTTSKGPLLAVPLVLVQLALLAGLRSKVLSSLFVTFLSTVCLLVPLTLTYLQPSRKGASESLSSFYDRIEDEWPRAFRLIDHPVQALWGRGLGGIGTAQTYGEPRLLDAADNVMVYFIITLGMLGPLYFFYYLYVLLKRTSERDYDDFNVTLLHIWTAAWVVDGIVSNMMEDAVTGMVLGVMIGMVVPSPQQALASSMMPAPRLARR